MKHYDDEIVFAAVKRVESAALEGRSLTGGEVVAFILDSAAPMIAARELREFADYLDELVAHTPAHPSLRFVTRDLATQARNRAKRIEASDGEA